jgi:hypothetical protein
MPVEEPEMQPELAIVLELDIELMLHAKVLAISFQADSLLLFQSIAAIVMDLEFGEFGGLVRAEFAFHVLIYFGFSKLAPLFKSISLPII